MRKIYLACPYSHPDPAVREARARQADLAAAWLVRQGKLVFSPISHGHALACALPDLPTDFAFWRKQCVSFLAGWADELAILALDGWEKSRGIKAEIAVAHARGMPRGFYFFQDGALQKGWEKVLNRPPQYSWNAG